MSAHPTTAGVGPWRPRASSVGYYMKCLWRAAQDKLRHYGQLPEGLFHEQDDTSYADLGTCIHFTLQDGTRCVFPGPPEDHAPTAEEWKSASSHFGGDLEVTRERVRAAATLGAQKLPKAPDGKPWKAEWAYENEWTTGHIDFLSHDGSIVGDLKTTTKPPVNRRIKAEHQAQLAVYHILTGAPKGFVLYVDSMRAAWTTTCWIDFLKPDFQFYCEQVKAFCQFLMSDRLLDVAYPNLDHTNCTGCFCPYTKSCYGRMAFPPGVDYNAVAARMPTGRVGFTGGPGSFFGKGTVGEQLSGAAFRDPVGAVQSMLQPPK